jgi:tetratricopeptide (TPR) repeat protein
MEKVKKIEEYLDGSMTTGEREKFEEATRKDAQLRDEVQFYREVNEAIMEQDVINFRHTIKGVIDQGESTPLRSPKNIFTLFRLPIAATIVLLLGLSIWHIILKDPGKIYDQNYAPYQSDISTRSVKQSNQKIDIAYLLYQEGDYEASYEILKNYLARNFDNPTARFYFGLNAIELNHPLIAIEELEKVANDETTPFSLHAKWYLALIHIELNQTEQAKHYLEELVVDKNMYSDRAEKIIRKLN